MTPLAVRPAGRTLPAGLASMVEALELEQARLVTTARLEELRQATGIATPARVIAARLRQRGWLLATRRRGVYEFAPGSHAGALSRGDLTLQLQAVLTARQDWAVGLTMQSAAWALGMADRAPARLEVAAPTHGVSTRLASLLEPDARVVTFAPILPMAQHRGVPVLAADSIAVHMATSPKHVRSWQSTVEWLPDLASDLTAEGIALELEGRPRSVAARLAYLVSGVRPDIDAAVAPPPGGKVYFGPRGPLLRHDPSRQIADTTLPFDPRTLSPVTS